MADVTAGLGLSARDKAALAEIRAITAGWAEPLTDAVIIRAAVRRLAEEWYQSPLEAERCGAHVMAGVRSRETITAWARDLAR